MNQGFNPQARWDRNMPETSSKETSEPEELDEKIDCLAWFKSAKIIPQEFTWNNKTYHIKKITYNWQERRGREVINLFSVDTGTGIYQISFNNTSYAWRLIRLLI